jgi:hypothetical protein
VLSKIYTGIENPGYGQQPPSYTSASGSNSPESGPLPTYEEVVKSSYYPPNTKQENDKCYQNKYSIPKLSLLTKISR